MRLERTLSLSNLNLKKFPLQRLLQYAKQTHHHHLQSMATDSLLLKRKTKVCFSIAAYSKDLISTLHHTSNVPIAPGLTNHELSTIESTFSFTFPPDLRSILREGLPIGHGFPNWRSSSLQQLHILINLPILALLKQISRQNFWHKNWGSKPHNTDDAVEIAKQYLKKIDDVPVLVPVYRNCYVPATPCVAGNPVFYVSGDFEVTLWSYDVVGFFQQTEFNGGELRLKPRPVMRLGQFLSAPLWAATESRTIEVWSELVECDGDRRWWLGGSELGGFLEGVRVKLRNGGWDEKDVDEMMMMMEINGGDEKLWHVRELAGRMLRAGWSSGDVVESLGCLTIEEDCTGEIENECGGDSLFDFEYNRYSCVGDGDGDGQGQSGSLGPVLKMQAIANE